MKRVGLLSYSSNTGLGIQTKEFYDHMEPTKTLVADLEKWNGMETHHKWYPDGRVCRDMPSQEEMDWLVDGIDVLFVCETPLKYYLFEKANEKGVKIIQQLNPEFWDYFREPHLSKPTILANPSTWMFDSINAQNIAPMRYWPVPTNRKNIPFRKIDKVETIIHIIGRPTAGDRNGTMEFLEAIKTIGNEYKYIVYLQPPRDSRARQFFEPVRQKIEETQKMVDIEIKTDLPKYTDLYKDGDILVLPRKYGGLCLPMQESLAAGIPVIMTDTSPNDRRLPIEWLADTESAGSFFAHTTIDLYKARIESLIDRIYYVIDNIKEANKEADKLAHGNSWEVLTSKYYQWINE